MRRMYGLVEYWRREKNTSRGVRNSFKMNVMARVLDEERYNKT